MYLDRPRFRLRPIILAVILAWPLAGVIWAVPQVVPWIIQRKFEAIWFLPFSAFGFTTGATLPDMGAPPDDRYFWIFSVLAILLVFATGMIRFGNRSQP